MGGRGGVLLNLLLVFICLQRCSPSTYLHQGTAIFHGHKAMMITVFASVSFERWFQAKEITVTYSPSEEKKYRIILYN